jgi:hypothetical protein
MTPEVDPSKNGDARPSQENGDEGETGLPASQQHVQDRLKRPPWLTPGNVTFMLGMLALLSYLVLYSFDARFLAAFDTSPEEIGLNEAAFVIRAGMYGSVLALGATICVLAVGFFIALAVASRMITREKLRFYSQRIQTRRTLVLAPLLGALATGVVVLDSPRRFGIWQHGATAFLLVFFTLVFWVFATYKYFVAVLLVVVFVMGVTVNLAFIEGKSVASSIQLHGETNFPLSAVGLDASRVSIEWTTPSKHPLMPKNVIYLGHANGVVLLSDGTKLFRVRDAQVSMITVQFPTP